MTKREKDRHNKEKELLKMDIGASHIGKNLPEEDKTEAETE